MTTLVTLVTLAFTQLATDGGLTLNSNAVLHTPHSMSSVYEGERWLLFPLFTIEIAVKPTYGIPGGHPLNTFENTLVTEFGSGVHSGYVSESTL